MDNIIKYILLDKTEKLKNINKHSITEDDLKIIGMYILSKIMFTDCVNAESLLIFFLECCNDNYVDLEKLFCLNLFFKIISNTEQYNKKIKKITKLCHNIIICKNEIKKICETSFMTLDDNDVVKNNNKKIIDKKKMTHVLIFSLKRFRNTKNHFLQMGNL